MSIMYEERKARKRIQMLPYKKILDDGKYHEDILADLIVLRNLLRKHKPHLPIDADLLKNLEKLLKPYTKDWEKVAKEN